MPSQKKKNYFKNIYLQRQDHRKWEAMSLELWKALLSTIPLYLWGRRPETWHILPQSITFHVYFCDLPQQSQLSSTTLHSSPWRHLALVQCLVYQADRHMTTFYHLRPGICWPRIPKRGSMGEFQVCLCMFTAQVCNLLWLTKGKECLEPWHSRMLLCSPRQAILAYCVPRAMPGRK